MVNIKKLILPVSFALSSSIFAQGQSYTGQLPKSYATTSKAAPVAVQKSVPISIKEQIDLTIDELTTSDPVLKNANWGFVIYDPKTEKVINSYNENNALVPASTTKLLTTETAMSLLGPKFRWNTQLEYSGDIDGEGTLNGNLYIVGSGDPSLGTGKAASYTYSQIVSDFLYAVSGLGIKKINGNIITQTAVFKENKVAMLPENIVWLERKNYYLPVGTTANVDPRNEKITVKKANLFVDENRYFYVSPYNKQMVFAELFTGSGMTTKLPDAPNFLANSLKSNLPKNGIEFTGQSIVKMTDPQPERRTIITSYKSPTLKEIIYYTNQRSDNALAEAILRMVGFQKAGDQTLESGRKVVVNHLKSKNFDISALNYMDGSGLSKSNFVTPMAQVKFLSNLMKEPYYKDFQESLPIAGQTGTLKKMFFGNSYGQILAKTGTLNRVKTLAGYIKTRTAYTLSFSMLVNNYSGSVNQVKARMEKLLDPAVDLYFYKIDSQQI